LLRQVLRRAMGPAYLHELRLVALVLAEVDAEAALAIGHLLHHRLLLSGRPWLPWSQGAWGMPGARRAGADSSGGDRGSGAHERWARRHSWQHKVLDARRAPRYLLPP